MGIRVNLLRPGSIDTPMHHRVRGLFGDDIYDKVLIPRAHTRRAGRPDEIAPTIVFLCSNEASYIAGSTLTPDRGFTLTVSAVSGMAIVKCAGDTPPTATTDKRSCNGGLE